MAKAAEAFRTISEVAEELNLHKHVLRFWEVKFPQIKPMKRGGGRRYYRPADMELLRGIRHLLHAEGYTIKGVQKILRERGVDAVKRVGSAMVSGGAAMGTSPPLSSLPDSAESVAALTPVERATAKSNSTGSAPRAASKMEAGSSPRSPERDSAETDRVGNIAKAIAELQECRAILTDTPAAKPDNTAAVKSKRVVRAAG